MATYENYRNLLRINKLRLDDELEIQAEHQLAISEEVSRLNTRMLEKQDELKRVEARLFEDEKENGGSEAQVKSRVVRSRDRAVAWAAYQQVRETYEQWDGLLEAWKAKGRNMKDLGELFRADYFAVRSVRGDDRPVMRLEDRPRMRQLDPADSDRASAPVRPRRAL